MQLRKATAGILSPTSAGRPNSTARPASSTITWSKSCKLESRCAIMIIAWCLNWERIIFCIWMSVWESTLEESLVVSQTTKDSPRTFLTCWWVWWFVWDQNIAFLEHRASKTEQLTLAVGKELGIRYWCRGLLPHSCRSLPRREHSTSRPSPGQKWFHYQMCRQGDCHCF